MKAVWSGHDYERMKRNPLPFAHEDVDLIRKGLAKRVYENHRSRQPLDSSANQQRSQYTRGFILDPLEDLLGVSVVGRNGHCGDYRALPGFLVFDFRHSHVELAAQTVFQTLDHLPFVFEGVRKFEPQL